MAHSSNSRNVHPASFGVNLLPFELFNHIQTGFVQFPFNASALSQHMENLSQQLGSVMENFSQMMSPLAGHNHRRVVWY